MKTQAKADKPAEAAKAELPKGAKAPLKSGGAPKGYEVKGNADSGLYHEPDGQWYDQTDAEFYFKTAQDAEAAGFLKAGSRSPSRPPASSRSPMRTSTWPSRPATTARRPTAVM